MTCNGSFYTCSSSSYTSIDAAPFPKPLSLIPKRKPFAPQFGPTLTLLAVSSAPSRAILVKTAASSGEGNNLDTKKDVELAEEEVEEELPWIQEKALDLVEFTGSVTQTIPGPRVGQSSLPWVLAVPLAYFGVALVIAVVKTVRKFNSPREKRRKLVNKNAMLCISLDELFEKGMSEVNQSALTGLMQKTGFDMKEILRKYIRYVLNEKPFNPDLIANLIHIRKETQLEDSKVAGILNDISGRIVNDKVSNCHIADQLLHMLEVVEQGNHFRVKLSICWSTSTYAGGCRAGPVVMDISGYSEKGFKRKLAVQALFGKIYYLAELPEFCSRDSSLKVKTASGVTDEDAEKLRLHTVSEIGDLCSLDKMIGESEEEEEEEASDDSAKAS